ncbi:hypothetical protein TNCV_3693961 [Trichonephila clavipes]|nr:hypothetical protein TNCV_3693961 [Trichonephila clavipes]
MLDLIQRCNSGVTCAVTSTHIIIILESLPKPGGDTLGDSKFLGYFQLGAPHSRRLIILPSKSQFAIMQMHSLYHNYGVIALKAYKSLANKCFYSLYYPPLTILSL